VTYFKEIQQHAPIVRSEELGGYWIVTRFADIEWVARNPDIVLERRPVDPRAPGLQGQGDPAPA
jgi:cytochrome P450